MGYLKRNAKVAGIAAAAMVVILGTGTAAAHCGQCGVGEASHTHEATIPEVAKEAGQFNTLLAAAKAAGLAETLSGEGPYTVFAPTDAAFEKLPEGTVEGLLEKPEQLKSILLHHVAEGKMKAEKVVKKDSITTLYGQPATIKVKDDGAMIDGARIVKTDVAASNGVIHVIDEVIMPKDIVDVAANTETFSTLVTAVKEAGLVDTLKGDGPYTVFAPTNDAFAKLPEGTVEELLKPENREKLQAILKYHVVPGKVKAAEVVEMDSTPTANGGTLTVDASAEGVRINDAKVVKTDIMATNGVIHVIDSVLIPDA